MNKQIKSTELLRKNFKTIFTFTAIHCLTFKIIIMKKLKTLALAIAMFMIYSCGEKTDVVESGTYSGTIEEVEADKSEIYVKTDDGKVLELYFTDSTSLTKNAETVAFDQLSEGKKVEVEVVKVGKKLDPKAVRILE